MTLDAQGFLERFAMIMSDSGYPRMAARVFAALLVSDDGHLTAAELGERLQVGPPAISGAIKYLMRVGMVTRERDPGERRDRYRVDQVAWFTAASSSAEVFRRFEDGAREGLEVFAPDTPVGARLEQTRSFFAFLRREVPALVNRWREESGEVAAAEPGESGGEQRGGHGGQ
ncbi:MarR family transcriptional regulator [Spongiactinospora sp. TRM90649]|uniref:GbsR/MarR family transcriptional regulator n=1 Tax=Spongiactinospora sp. TRM90649 TaxID=3031114 RepID=UPI0023F67719|nr:MarR family transcriptional regulator [Spongiactinospora sp. TRM90649]MDF5751650.1 MarR family transcriptional regulator [Spongiactinospora sp. TRM90649]